MKDLSEYEFQIMEIDELLRPIAKRPVDTENPNWMEVLRQSEPLDEAGVRSVTESLLKRLIHEYLVSEADTRSAIRKFFTSYDSFAWAATLRTLPVTNEDFRDHLILFSMRDQGKDSRDALLELLDLCEGGRAAGVNIEPILKEVAEISSDIDRYGMGSTKQQIENPRAVR